jgi:hypothetical protein
MVTTADLVGSPVYVNRLIYWKGTIYLDARVPEYTEGTLKTAENRTLVAG